MYVNFTNYTNDIIDKTFSKNPNHRDPVGLYAYPLDLVLNNSPLITYGHNFKYIRVIRNISKNPLMLNNISTEKIALKLLDKMNLKYDKSKFVALENFLNSSNFNLYETNVNFYGKLFFAASQRDDNFDLISSVDQNQAIYIYWL